MKKLKSILTRGTFGVTAVSLLLIAAAPLLDSGSALAYGQITFRSIQMSTAHISASDNMTVSFTPATTGTQSINVDFCQESPIYQATCTAPTGFSVSSATFTAGTGTSNWSTSGNTANTFKALKNTGSALTTSAASFTITGATNPSSTGTFYARIYLYGSSNSWVSPTNVGTPQDFGGIALSTVSDIVINATVQETLTFCTSKAAPGNGCSSLSSPSLTLGNGGSPNVLDANGVYTDTAYTQLTTNASHGAVVDMFQTGGWSCAGLSSDGGTTCGIPGLTSLGAITAGTADFGMNVDHTGALTPNANYTDASGTYDYRATVKTAPGDPIESSSGAVTNGNNKLTFAATASPTTAAGVYSTNDSLIATGTF